MEKDLHDNGPFRIQELKKNKIKLLLKSNQNRKRDSLDGSKEKTFKQSSMKNKLLSPKLYTL